jgi:nucleoside-diphosphate-sugar epimerase
MTPSRSSEVLLFGASGPIGMALLPRLVAAGHHVHAITRAATPRVTEGVHWHRGTLPDAIADVPTGVDAIISAGPLDLFAHWHAAHAPRTPRLLAFGSTSVHVKQASTDPAERDVAARLTTAEARLAATAGARGEALTLLRPTLIYGSGREANLGRLVALARRFGGVPLPADARGRRQPVHADDLAQALLAAWPSAATHGRAYDLPGGETLAYDAMLARVLGVLQPPCRVWRVPSRVFDTALALAHRLGRARGFSVAMRARLGEDLVFDAAPAMRDFGYAPRPFQPTAAMFPPE